MELEKKGRGTWTEKRRGAWHGICILWHESGYKRNSPENAADRRRDKRYNNKKREIKKLFSDIINVFLFNRIQVVKENELEDVILHYHYKVDKGKLPFYDTLYDVICGATADDKLFVTLDMYPYGFLSKQQAIYISGYP